MAYFSKWLEICTKIKVAKNDDIFCALIGAKLLGIKNRENCNKRTHSSFPYKKIGFKSVRVIKQPNNFLL